MIFSVFITRSCQGHDEAWIAATSKYDPCFSLRMQSLLLNELFKIFYSSRQAAHSVYIRFACPSWTVINLWTYFFPDWFWGWGMEANCIISWYLQVLIALIIHFKAMARVQPLSRVFSVSISSITLFLGSKWLYYIPTLSLTSNHLFICLKLAAHLRQNIYSKIGKTFKGTALCEDSARNSALSIVC